MMIFFSSGIFHSQMHSMMITGVGVQTFGDNQEKVRPFIEFGILKQKSGDIIHAHPNISLTSKIELSDNPFGGINFGGWIERPVIFGLHSTLYSNIKHLSLKVRPEIGWCFKNQFRLHLGYNVTIFNNKNFNQASTIGCELSCSYAFRIKK